MISLDVPMAGKSHVSAFTGSSRPGLVGVSAGLESYKHNTDEWTDAAIVKQLTVKRFLLPDPARLHYPPRLQFQQPMLHLSPFGHDAANTAGFSVFTTRPG